MAPNPQEQWQLATRIQRQLLTKLKEKDSLFEDIEHLMQELRIACETTIFLDFDFATSEKVEQVLWDAHSQINSRYRKITSRFKAEDHKRHVVEKRKWNKRYADFLKTSQYFYKGYIQRLASHFAGMTELRKIAHRLNLTTLSVDDRVQVSAETAHKILLSCHSTLLRLGDLYRYRNDLNTRDKSWDKTYAHYDLANDLYPDSGDAFNQMAVVSLSEGNHMDAVYHLYRALAVEKPNPNAKGNLAVEFKKITNEWEAPAKYPSRGGGRFTSKTNTAATPLILWFVRLHAKLYKGVEFESHDELENEVLSQMTVLLKEQSLEGIVDKFVLINIAAEFFAGVRVKENTTEENLQSYYFFLRLNIRVLFMLLQLLQPELDGPSIHYDIPDVTGRQKIESRDNITVVTRRVLPALRQYSTWLVSNAPIVVKIGTASLNVHVKEMWAIYALTLSTLAATFPAEDLPVIEYLLEEDAATVGFKPLRDSSSCNIYTNGQELKSRTTDQGVKQHLPNVEMLGRIRDLLKDGEILAADNEVPLYTVNGEFRYSEDGPPFQSPPVNIHSFTTPIPTISETNSGTTWAESTYRKGKAIQRSPSATPSVVPSDSHQSMSTDMYRMVDDLVSPSATQKAVKREIPNESSYYGMHSGTPGDVFSPNVNSGRPVSRSKALPSLPGIWGSAFSPQPGELQRHATDRSSTTARFSSLQLQDNSIQTAENSTQFAAITPIDHATSYSSHPRNVWGNDIDSGGFKPSDMRQTIGSQLQQSLADQYQSSGFSAMSSIYQGTPQPSYQHIGSLHGHPQFGNHSSLHTSTNYAGASDFDHTSMLQSSIWNGSQPAKGGPIPTPPGGQGG